MTFRVNGLDLTYANIWQTLLQKNSGCVDFLKRGLYANMIVNWPGLNDINSFWPGDYEQFMKFL